LAKFTFGTMTICKMTFGKMTIAKMTNGKIYLQIIALGKMALVRKMRKKLVVWHLVERHLVE
jgi:hypothetical protein